MRVVKRCVNGERAGLWRLDVRCDVRGWRKNDDRSSRKRGVFIRDSKFRRWEVNEMEKVKVKGRMMFFVLRREGMVVPFVGDEQPNVSPTVAARQ